MAQYQPPTHQPPTTQEIQHISDSLHYGCSPQQVEAMRANITKTLDILKVLDRLPDNVPEVRYPRTPGYRPAPEDNPGNAWAWRCDIKGAETGKLGGKTVAIKDNVAVAGVPMSNGSLVLEGYMPEYDATVTSRILNEGGHILGKASCDDFCLSAMGFSSVDGFIHMPSTPDLRVGGSSCGSAVLVATGQVDLAIACDQGGSIRIPAAWTGTVGLKPTHGLVPYTGIVSIEPSLDHVGPIARDVRGCALLLEAIAGYDGLDGRQQQQGTMDVPAYSDRLTERSSGFKIGILKDGFDLCDEKTQIITKQCLAKVKDHMKGQVSFEEVNIPYHKHASSMFVGLMAGIQANTQTGTSGLFLKGFYPTSLHKAVRQGMHTNRQMLAPGIKFFDMSGELMNRRYGNHYYCKARNLIRKLSQQYDAILETCDIIVMPTLTHTASTFVKKENSEEEDQQRYLVESLDMIANTQVADLTGHPALTLPLGDVGDGTFPSLMLVGKMFDDLTVLQVAALLEAIPGHVKKGK